MISKTLIKLIDQAILPAVILVASKILALIFVNYKFNLDWQLGPSGIIYSSKSDFIIANSYSSLFMYFSITIGLILLIIRADKWHATHIEPKLSAKLFEKKLNFVITDNFNLYSKAVVWLSYSWLAAALMLIQSYYNLLTSWVAYTALAISTISTILMIADMEKEINNKPSKESLKREVLSFSDLTQVIKNP